jgi:chloramphenicol 3-O phosphotransferase
MSDAGPHEHQSPRTVEPCAWLIVMQRRLIVITGSSGVGKSTLARALQEELLPDQWLHFSIDSLFYCLPRSVVLRVDEQNDRSLVDSRAIVSAAYACTRTLLDLGHRVIFDAVILAENGAREMLRAFDGFDPLFVELTCSWDEIERRTLARGDRTLAEAEHGYSNAGGHFEADHTFDSSSESAEKIAAQLSARLRGAASVA